MFEVNTIDPHYVDQFADVMDYIYAYKLLAENGYNVESFCFNTHDLTEEWPWLKRDFKHDMIKLLCNRRPDINEFDIEELAEIYGYYYNPELDEEDSDNEYINELASCGMYRYIFMPKNLEKLVEITNELGINITNIFDIAYLCWNIIDGNGQNYYLAAESYLREDGNIIMITPDEAEKQFDVFSTLLKIEKKAKELTDSFTHNKYMDVSTCVWEKCASFKHSGDYYKSKAGKKLRIYNTTGKFECHCAKCKANKKWKNKRAKRKALKIEYKAKLIGISENKKNIEFLIKNNDKEIVRNDAKYRNASDF